MVTPSDDVVRICLPVWAGGTLTPASAVFLTRLLEMRTFTWDLARSSRGRAAISQLRVRLPTPCFLCSEALVCPQASREQPGTFFLMMPVSPLSRRFDSFSSRSFFSYLVLISWISRSSSSSICFLVSSNSRSCCLTSSCAWLGERESVCPGKRGHAAPLCSEGLGRGEHTRPIMGMGDRVLVR